MNLNSGRHGRRGNGVRAGVLATSTVLVLGAAVVASTLMGTPLDKSASLADMENSGLTHPASFTLEQDDLEAYAEVLTVNGETGEKAVEELQSLPTDSYGGFLFQADEAMSPSTRSRVEQAAQEGIVEHIHGDTYSCDSLSALSGVAEASELSYVEPDYAMHLVGSIDLQSVVPAGGTTANPAPDYPVNDPYPNDSPWNLEMLNVKDAWELGLDGDPYVYGGKPLHDGPVKVAVIDTGLYGTGALELQHEDIDYTHVQDVKNVVTTASGAPDAKGHGTFVSGLIFAKANNNVGVAGLTPGVNIVPVKVFDTGDASTSDVVKGIYYAVDEAHVDVINMSLGGEGDATTLREACEHAEDEGVLVVASAGNDGVSTPNYPAAYDSVVGVASVNSAGVRSSWSQYGKSVFVTAPGENVTSTYIGATDAYRTGSGTSFSGPEVAALAALCKSVYPDITMDVFEEFLIETSRDYGSPGYDDFYGWGLVDFGAVASHVLDSQTLSWYTLDFNAAAEDGTSIDDARVTLEAAEDISWDTDVESQLEAGSITAGTQITPEADGTFRVHRGTYKYAVEADGYYRVEGTVKTYSAHQAVPITMENAYAVDLSIVDAAGNPLDTATIEISSIAGRHDQPISTDGASRTYALASGTYTYVAQAPGCADQTGSFTVQRANASLQLAMYPASSLVPVTFTATDKDDNAAITAPTVIVQNASGMTVDPDASGAFRLARGVSYTAIVSKLGYEDASVSFTVGLQQAQTVPVQLVRAECQVSFRIVNSDGRQVKDAAVTVRNQTGSVAAPSATDALRYNLKGGSYTYQVQAPGYQDAQATFYLSIESRVITVVMKGVEQSVSFNVTDAETGQAITDASVKVMTTRSFAALPAQPDGTYMLEPGSYRYTIYKVGYQAALGNFEVSGPTSVSVALTKPAASTVGFAGGNGTAENPYLIATEDQLRYLAQQTQIVRNGGGSAWSIGDVGKDTHYQVVGDIACHGEWLPIGNYENSSNYRAFCGHFDGGGYTISGIVTADGTCDGQALFGCTKGAEISNVTVDGSIVGDTDVGGIVGYNIYEGNAYSDDWATGSTTIKNCVNRAKVSGRFAVGGIIGSSAAGISSSSGLASPYGVVISQCANLGSVTATSRQAGGIAGWSQRMGITYCYNQAPITGDSSIGGIAGSMATNSYMGNCYSSGSVSYTTTISALVSYCGGVVGSVNASSVASCYAVVQDGQLVKTSTGSVNSASSVTNCAMLPQANMFRNDDFVATLNVDAENSSVSTTFVKGNDYPYLWWEARAMGDLAERPRILAHPTGNLDGDAYDQGSSAAALAARCDAVGDGGAISWQWYAASDADGVNAQPIAGASGQGTQASYTPSTSTVGITYYFVRFTNTVGSGSSAYDASADTKVAGIAVRSNVKAQAPVISKLNPTQSAAINYQVRAKQLTIMELSVEAGVADGGELSYQWYQSPSRQGTGTPVEGATGSTYTPPTDDLGTVYYYVTVTNTLEHGNTATVTSDWIQADVVPYTISTFEELASFRSLVNEGTNFAGCTVTLTEDIAIPATEADWEPIGSRDNPFCGVFMGGTGQVLDDNVTAHKITGLAINGDNHGNYCLGLFGVVSTPGAVFGLEVQGTITGANNTAAGLVAGMCLTDTSGNGGTMGNCAAMPGSSVEGKYQIGGLVGYGNITFVECANHADVRGHAFNPTSEESSILGSAYNRRILAVGGLAGTGSVGITAGCYNTGDVTIDACGPTQYSAVCVGGVIGYSTAHGSMSTCFNTGKVTVGTTTTAYNGRGVRHAGAVAGYIAYDRFDNLHYLEGTYPVAIWTESGNDYSESHSRAYMRTPFFLSQINDGSYAKNYVRANDGLPRLSFETDLTTPDSNIDAAEPYLYPLQMDGEEEFADRLFAYRYKDEVNPNVKLQVASPEGGVLSYRWQVRTAGAGDDAWGDMPGASGTPTDGAALLSVPTDTVGTFEYRCIVTNTVSWATADKTKDSICPVFTVEVRPNDAVIALRDPSSPNAAGNPWVVDSPEKLAFLSDLVNGKTKLTAVPDPTFLGQYIELANDIDLSGFANWAPLGNGTNAFMGCFNGNNHSITGLSIKQVADDVEADCAYKGLFGYTYYPALICNLSVSGRVDVNNKNAWNTGGVVGYGYATQVMNVASDVDVTGAEVVGGIMARAVNSQIVDCENRGDIALASAAISDGSKGKYFGGVVGYTSKSIAIDGTGLYTSFNSGKVTAKAAWGEHRFGALVGCRENAVDFPVTDCYYLDGTVVCTDDASKSQGAIGTTGKTAEEDRPGITTALANANSPQTAWALDTDDGDGDHVRRWGNFALANETTPGVHLVMGDESRITYHIDDDSVAAAFTLGVDGRASDGYVTAGQAVTVDWADKPGFTVTSVGYQVGDAAPVPVAKGASFTMPASDVKLVAQYTQQAGYRYAVSSSVTNQGVNASADVASITLGTTSAGYGQTVSFEVKMASGYQQRSLTVTDADGRQVAVNRTSVSSYSFAMPPSDALVHLDVEPVGTAVTKRADSLSITEAAIHNRSTNPAYRTGTLLYDTIAFSGSGFGRELYYMTNELEGFSSPALYEQSYSLADGTTHRFTGRPLVDVLERLGATVANDTPVLIETADGSSHLTTGAELRSLGYSSYDRYGTPVTRGLPVLLAFGRDGTPNTDGGVSVVFGQKSAADNNAVVSHVTRIAVGQDIDYMQHVYAPYDNPENIAGAKDVVIRIYRGENVVKESSFSYLDIEAMARADRSGIQRGNYSTLVYEDDETIHSGPFTDYYEGYDLYKVLQAAGVPYVPQAKVQFYQTAEYGLENSWKTVNVNLGYLAGNGPAGAGDYSRNVNYYGRDETTNTGGVAVWGVRPMIAYGKNGLPLNYASGSVGVDPSAYNYRGPLLALLPQNADEGGTYVKSDTVSACFLGLIEVHLDEFGADIPTPSITTQDKTLAPLMVTGDGETRGQTVRTKVITPSDGAIQVESSDPSIATANFDEKTGELVVSAVASGSCTVRVRAQAGVLHPASDTIEVPVKVGTLESLGGSLRTDVFGPDGKPDASVASLRLGYRIAPMPGISDLRWYWTYDTDAEPDDSGYARTGDNYLRNRDGSLITNLVFTDIKAQYFDRPIYARLVVTGTDADGNRFTWRDDVRSRSVSQVATAVAGDTNAVAQAKALARALLGGEQ